MALTKVSRGLLSTGIVDNSNATAITIDSSENVGIGTGSPQANLQVLGTIKVATGNDLGILGLGEANGTTVNAGIFRGAANNPTSGGNFLNLGGYDGIVFAASNAAIGSQTEAMRIDSSGNLLVGNTVANPASGFSNQLGFGFTKSTGKVEIATTANDAVMELGKNEGTDGNLLVFRKQSTTVGVIQTKSSQLSIGTGDTGIQTNQDVNAIIPHNTATNANVDNSIDLGYAAGGSNFRFKDLKLSGGIYLGGTGSANYLDDYEEGTWTPVIGAGTATYGTAWYIKIGRLVTVHANVYSVSDSASSNNVYLNGLPFSSGASSKGSSTGAMIGGRISNGPFFPYIGVSSSTVYFYDQNSGAYNTFKHADMTSQTDFHFTISYWTDS